MAAEIAEQPDAWSRLLAEGGAAVVDVARQVRRRAPRFVLLVARGTSDHAALYAKYLVEVRLGLPAGLGSPSTMTAYGARPDLRDVLLIAISQSGGSPDLVRSLEVGRAQGALTVAVTNNPGSPLDEVAELGIPVQAGPERSVAATKSYTAELLTLYLLTESLREAEMGPVHRLPDWGARVLALEPTVAEAATRYRYAQRMVVTGRGYAYPTAREAALKLMETCYLSAHAFSGADLLHGPFAMIDPQVPVLTVAPEGVAGVALEPVQARLAETGADVLTVGSRAAAAKATVGLALPDGIPEALSPILEIVPFQQLALHLAILRGTDPDHPRGLRKVTETR
ncbi:MAG: SIS domain-containing protein [Pseudonocardia sp.]|nr:SIS domain-containing protein [Pseudonocardia sp.]